MKAWAGLGYYARARNLHACAAAVVRDHGGRFPETAAGLKALPGIGDYTAAAIAAIAFDEPVAVIDGNIERVIARLFAIDTPLPAAKKEIRARQQALTPQDARRRLRPGDDGSRRRDLHAEEARPAPSVRSPPNAWRMRAAKRKPIRSRRRRACARRATALAFVAVRERRRGAAAPAAGQAACSAAWPRCPGSDWANRASDLSQTAARAD